MVAVVYALTSLGFTSPSPQVDREVWFDIFFAQLSESDAFSYATTDSGIPAATDDAPAVNTSKTTPGSFLQSQDDTARSEEKKPQLNRPLRTPDQLNDESAIVESQDDEADTTAESAATAPADSIADAPASPPDSVGADEAPATEEKAAVDPEKSNEEKERARLERAVADSIAAVALADSIRKANQPWEGRQDSIRMFTVVDSLIFAPLPDSVHMAADTLQLDYMAIDSTARKRNLRYNRRDIYHLSLYEPHSSAFYVKPASHKKTTRIDSTGEFVIVEETVGGVDRRASVKIPLEEYLSRRLAVRERELWEEEGYRYNLDLSKRDLSEVIKDITDFEIPLPSVGVLSIFGPPKISLKIGGSVDIHAAWRNESTEGVTVSRLGNTRNEPDFKQQVQINVDGTIGDKLKIMADWNTERTFEYENQLKINYTGYEDEIVQSVEAGNVSLQTSSLVGGSEALFGVKANFILGPLNLTTLVSQKKGEVKEKDVSGGTTSQEFEIRVYDYSTNHFFLDQVYADTTDPDLNLFYRYYGKATPEINRYYYVKNIEVWKSINQTLQDPTERNANVYIDLPPRSAEQTYDEELRDEAVEEVPGEIVKGRFILLSEGIDYVLHPETGYISMKTQTQETDIIAVSYQIEAAGGEGNDLYYGEFINQSAGADTSARLLLKLVKPQYLQPQMTKAWNLQLKNIYPLGARNIQQEGFELDIKYEVQGQDPQSVLGATRLLQAFGLDLVGENKFPPADGNFDWFPSKTVDPSTGEIIFPRLQPFGRSIPKNIPDYEQIQFLDVYDTSKTFARQNKVLDKFIITGKYSGTSSSVYQLGFNVVENSAKVFLDGRELTPGVDYSVDYTIGQLTIRNDAALVPGANLRITYEENDLFQLASKTLAGARGLIDIADETQIGFSFLTLSQQTLSDKVRIGEEPLSNSIFGVDFNSTIELPFLTKGLDYLVSTRAPSSLTVKGEVAYMSPDPNTKKSNIVSDEGESIAYIDDFEGSKRIIPVGINYGGWHDLSIPNNIRAFDLIENTRRLDSLMLYKGKAWWYNILPSDVVVDMIWPLKTTAREDDRVTVLDFVFQPDTPGTYNYQPDFRDPTYSWGGMMRTLSSTASNLVDENIEFIEFWLNVQSAPTGAKMYIDLGRISEDVIPNNRLDREDKNSNELIDDGEDTGIDGLDDGAEQATFESNRSDPSGDNFVFSAARTNNPYDYFNINGTQGNAALTDIGRVPDTEDLNRNGSLDAANSFFRYEVPIDTNAATNPFIAGGGGNNAGWFLYRIPLDEFEQNVGEASFTLVEYIRLFVEGVREPVHLRLAEFNLVGNQWQKFNPEDSVLSLSVVNVEDNPGYTIPPGVERERDRTQPDQEIFKNEQSLNLKINGLPTGEDREAVKYLLRPLDVFNYRQMKLFIHGELDQSPTSVSYYVNEDEYNSEVYFRFGTDVNNFYEYRQPVRQGWNEISIQFDQLTAIKQARDSVDLTQDFKIPVEGEAGHFYVVRGNPTLTKIKFLSVGILNVRPEDNPMDLFGEIWVNELRVVGADDTPGWAYTTSTALKLADLMTVNFNMSETDPYFHRLPERFGSRVQSKKWGMSANLDVVKMMPFSMPGSNIKINYSHTESFQNPLFLPGTDVKVEEAKRITIDQAAQEGREEEGIREAENLEAETQTVSVSDTWTLSNFKIAIPSDAWYFRDTWNAISFSFNYNKTFSRNPNTESSQKWLWNASANYSHSFSPDFYIWFADIPLIGTIVSLFDDYRKSKFYFTPQSLQWSLQVKRNYSHTQNRAKGGQQAPPPTISRDFTSQRGFDYSWKLTEDAFINLTHSYKVDVNSTLSYLETDADENPRTESEIWSDIFGGAFFGKDYRYNQSFDLKADPRFPSLFDFNRYFTLTAGYGVTYQWNNDFRQPELGRSASFSNRSQVNLKFRLKALMDPLFGESGSSRGGFDSRRSSTQRTRQPRGEDSERDGGKTEEEAASDSTSDGPGIIGGSLNFLAQSVRALLFDYENISVDFNNSVQYSASGLKARGTGFENFWAIQNDLSKGPSRMFMLGLDTEVGERAPNANLNNRFSEKNGFTIRTSRPLWEGAKLDLDWKVDWSMNRSVSLTSDSLGNTSIETITSTGNLTRSFLAMPNELIFSFLGNGITKVHELYDPTAPNPGENLSEAFIEGFETLPLIGKLGFLNDVVKYIPRPNWKLSWSGLEELWVFESWAQTVRLDHAYTSQYTEGWKLTPEGDKLVQTQKISYGFSPLIGLNITFDELWEGNLTGSLKYGAKTAYDLGVTTQNITETSTRDISFTVNYSKSGFELPLFGINLRNDIEFSFAYTLAKNSSVIFDMRNFIEEGTPQNGTNTVTIEPRIKYVISSRVTLSLFYRRVQTDPEGAARIPPTTRNEAGLDIRISIQ